MRGFSLIEILISIAIFAIVASVGFLSLFGYRERQALNLTVEKLTAILRDAERKAVEQECVRSEAECQAEANVESWGVRFNADLNNYSLFQGADYGTGYVVSLEKLKPEVKFIDPPSGVKDIVFSQRSGLPNPAPFTVKVALSRSDAVFKIITIDVNGTINAQ